MAESPEQAPASVTPPPAPRIRRGRRFFVGISVLMTVIVFVGFWSSYFGPLLRGTIEAPPLIHFHAAVFMGWIGLFIAQVTLAARGMVRWHMKLGELGVGYGIALVGVGVFTGISRSADLVMAGGTGSQLLYVASLDMALFASFFAAAVLHRKRPQVHKRLMLVAATILLVAAVARLPFFPAGPMRDHLRMLVWAVPILAAIGYDLRNRLGVHPAYVVGLAGLALRNYSVPASETEVWTAVTRWVTSWVL